MQHPEIRSLKSCCSQAIVKTRIYFSSEKYGQSLTVFPLNENERVRFQFFKAASIKWLSSPDDGANKNIWNFGQFLPDYMAQHLRIFNWKGLGYGRSKRYMLSHVTRNPPTSMRQLCSGLWLTRSPVVCSLLLRHAIVADST